MSRDFSPRDCWHANEMSKRHGVSYGIYLQNYNYETTFGDDRKESDEMFTKENLEDRRKHPYIAVLGCEIYDTARHLLPEARFEELNDCLELLVKADMEGKDTSAFRREITDWYYNRGGYYSHEENDARFYEYIKTLAQNKEDLTKDGKTV